jgi:SAM-dependent methyltransferase
MHKSAYDKAEYFVKTYLSDYKDKQLNILDIGSKAVTERHITHRQLFNNTLWEYTGLDIEEGANVDIVVTDPYKWNELRDNSFDAIICGQVFEHIPYVWKTIEEIARVLKPQGIAFIIAPGGGPEHKYPVDCWRMYPDSMKGLAEYTNCVPIEVSTQWKPLYYTDGSDKWKDTFMVMQKPTAENNSVIDITDNKHMAESFSKYRRNQAKYFSRYKRKAISGHARGLVKEIFTL